MVKRIWRKRVLLQNPCLHDTASNCQDQQVNQTQTTYRSSIEYSYQRSPTRMFHLNIKRRENKTLELIKNGLLVEKRASLPGEISITSYILPKSRTLIETPTSSSPVMSWSEGVSIFQIYVIQLVFQWTSAGSNEQSTHALSKDNSSAESSRDSG